MSVSKDWKMVVEECPMLKSFNPYEECMGFVPACNYLIKHKNISIIPAFTLYDAFGLEKKTIGRLAEVMGKILSLLLLILYNFNAFLSFSREISELE